MRIQDVISILDELAPLKYAEDFDNVGLLVGDNQAELSGILVTLDTLEPVVDEAIRMKCNLIVSFHPILFKGLKALTGKTYVERTVLKAIKNDIAIFAIHTALDNAYNGVNDIICNQLDLVNKRILIPKKDAIKKLVTYAPTSDAPAIRSALFDSGAGAIGNYESCSFNFEGVGTFKGKEGSDPVVGLKGEFQQQQETAISITFPPHLEPVVLKTLFKTHPYEEVAYEISSLNNSNQHIGMGMIGELEEELEPEIFFEQLKIKMNTTSIRHSAVIDQPIKSVAVLGGSGSFAIDAAKYAGADVFVSADFKYHDFFKAEGEIILADIGHYESEQFTKTFLTDYLSKKISNFAPAFELGKIIESKTKTNPVNYL